MGGSTYRYDCRSGGVWPELGGSKWSGAWGTIQVVDEDKGDTKGSEPDGLGRVASTAAWTTEK